MRPILGVDTSGSPSLHRCNLFESQKYIAPFPLIPTRQCKIGLKPQIHALPSYREGACSSMTNNPRITPDSDLRGSPQIGFELSRTPPTRIGLSWNMTTRNWVRIAGECRQPELGSNCRADAGSPNWVRIVGDTGQPESGSNCRGRGRADLGSNCRATPGSPNWVRIVRGRRQPELGSNCTRPDPPNSIRVNLRASAAISNLTNAHSYFIIELS